MLPWHLTLAWAVGFHGCHELPVTRDVDADGGTQCPVPRGGRQGIVQEVRLDSPRVSSSSGSWGIPVLTLTPFSITHMNPLLAHGGLPEVGRSRKEPPFLSRNSLPVSLAFLGSPILRSLTTALNLGTFPVLSLTFWAVWSLDCVKSSLSKARD